MNRPAASIDGRPGGTESTVPTAETASKLATTRSLRSTDLRVSHPLVGCLLPPPEHLAAQPARIHTLSPLSPESTDAVTDIRLLGHRPLVHAVCHQTALHRAVSDTTDRSGLLSLSPASRSVSPRWGSQVRDSPFEESHPHTAPRDLTPRFRRSHGLLRGSQSRAPCPTFTCSTLSRASRRPVLQVFLRVGTRASLCRCQQGHEALSFHGLSSTATSRCRASPPSPPRCIRSVPSTAHHRVRLHPGPCSICPSIPKDPRTDCSNRLSDGPSVFPYGKTDLHGVSDVKDRVDFQPCDRSFRPVLFGRHRFPGCHGGTLQAPCQR